MRRAQGCKKVGEERSPKMDPEKGERGQGGWVVGSNQYFSFLFPFSTTVPGMMMRKVF